MRKCENIVETYCKYTAAHEAPESFHFWCCLAAIALATKGTRYVNLGQYKAYLDLYVLLLARSAECRKSGAILKMKEIMLEAGLITPDTVPEKLTTAMLWRQSAQNVDYYGNSTMCIIAHELSLFLSKQEAYSDLIPYLTARYETGSGTFVNKTKNKGSDYLVDPFLVTMLGTTPTDFANLIPGAATGSGFTPRLAIIYEEHPKKRDAFPEENPERRKLIVEDLNHIFKICKAEERIEVKLSSKAKEWFKDWYESPQKHKKPDNPVLDGWFARKHVNVLKVGNLLSLAERDEAVVEKQHLEKGLIALNKLEKGLSKAYGMLGKGKHVEHEDRIIEQLQRAGGKLTRSQFYHLNSQLLTAVELSIYLNDLEIKGKVKKVEEGKALNYILKEGG